MIDHKQERNSKVAPHTWQNESEFQEKWRDSIEDETKYVLVAVESPIKML
jgi:hypothetical protein